MSPVSIFLLVIAAIFLIGIMGEILFARTGVPDVIWLILVGIAIGPVFGLVDRTQLGEIAPYFGALTLVIVLFNGGSELRLQELARAASRGTVLALFGFSLSVAVITGVAEGATLVGLLPETWGWMHCAMLGTILGGSSSVVIMPALAKAGLAPRISNLVNLESALTDVLSVVGTGAVVYLLRPIEGAAEGTPEPSMAANTVTTLARSFGIGVVVGLIAGLLAVLTLRRLTRSAYAYPLTLGYLLILYVVVDEMHGSAALAILVADVMIGNAPTLSKAIGLAREARLGRNVRGVHGELTFMVKSFFFTFIGAMLGPPWGGLLFGIGLGLILLLARVPSVMLATVASGLSRPAKKLTTFLYPRGMAAGVLAMWPAQQGVPDTADLPVIVFAAVFTTILVFAAGFPILRRQLGPGDLEATGPGTAATPAPALPTGATGGVEVPAPGTDAIYAFGDIRSELADEAAEDVAPPPTATTQPPLSTSDPEATTVDPGPPPSEPRAPEK